MKLYGIYPVVIRSNAVDFGIFLFLAPKHQNMGGFSGSISQGGSSPPVADRVFVPSPSGSVSSARKKADGTRWSLRKALNISMRLMMLSCCFIYIYIYVYVCLFLPWPTLAPKVNQWTRDWQEKGGNHRKPILISCLNNGEQTQTTIPINIDPEWRVVLQQPELSVYSDSLSKWSQF